MKKIKITDLTFYSTRVVGGLELDFEYVDSCLKGVIPKIFYHYGVDENREVIIEVPDEYGEQVRKALANMKVVIINARRYGKVTRWRDLKTSYM